MKKGRRISDDTPPPEESVEGHADNGADPDVPAQAAAAPEAHAVAEAEQAPTAELEHLAPEMPPETPAEGLPALEELGPLQMASELERARKERQEFLDGWQRARAEFSNYRKRVEREQEEARTRIAGETLLRVLGVLDDLERALKDRPADGETAAWADGIELIYKKFQGVLESQGVVPIHAEGQTFDPALHEALSHEESEEHSEGAVIEVVQRGYCVGDRVLRPALVRVAK